VADSEFNSLQGIAGKALPCNLYFLQGNSGLNKDKGLLSGLFE
jgi:hypothetical protein